MAGEYKTVAKPHSFSHNQYFAIFRITELTVNEVYHALSDPTRREILRLLRSRAMTAGEICDHFELARSTMSGHLKELRYAGLVVAEKHGTSVVYSLNMSVVEQALAAIVELLSNE